MRQLRSRSGLAGLAFLLATGAFLPATPTSLGAQQVDESLFDALQWENIGPARGGRSTAVAGSGARPLEYWFGATGGGLWKTTDGGLTWSPVTDGKIHSASVGAVGVCEAEPNVVYIGTGETELRGNVMQGDGVYRTTDGGETWTHLGLAETQNVARVRVHPTDCNTAWVAAFGKHSVPNPERGVYKTTDGGETWTKTLFVSPRAGAIELVVDPSDPDVLYASTWEAWRKSWGMSSGGDDSRIFKSTDAGETWTDITRNPGLPVEGPIGKIGLAVSAANPARVWALIEHEPDGGVYRSDDAGATWERVNDDRKLRQRAFYYSRIYADPEDPEVVYALNTGLYRSNDGGETFPRQLRVPHGDNHDLWIAPDDPDRMINANDGGANVSVNGGRTWTEQDYPTAQFYRVITTTHEPYMVCGAQQDNSTVCIPQKDWRHLSAADQYFYSVGGCESGYIAPNPVDPDVFYAGCYGGALERYDHATGLSRAVNVWPENPMGQSAEDLRERVQWTYPIVFSHHDPDVLYTGTQKVWRTTNEGQSWTAISPDLTAAIDSTMGPSGGPITRDQTGVETFATVFALAPSYHDPNVIWAGSDDGLVHVTRNGQVADPEWVDVTPPDAPPLIRINTIEASPTTPGKAYVAGIRYLVEDDRHPYVWKTTDYGRTWTRIDRGIPEDDFVRAVREDPVRPGLLYAASEKTVHVSWDDGAHWQPLSLGLPVTQVSDLVVEENDLVIATHGRSFWVLRNIGPLRQVRPELAAEDLVLYDPTDPVRGFDGALDVVYYLEEDADSVTVEFLDAEGDVVRTFAAGRDAEAADTAGAAQGEERETEAEEEGNGRRGGRGPSPSLDAGSHHFRWDMRYPGYTDFEGRIFWAAGNQGPAALPGRYTVRMTADGTTRTRDFEIRMNPRAVEAGVTLADLKERFDLAMTLRDRVSDANEAVIRIRRIDEQVGERLDETDAPAVEALGNSVRTHLDAVEEEIYQVRNRSNQDPLNFPIKLNNKLAALMSVVEGSESRPTDQSYEVFHELDGRLDRQLERMRLVIQEEVGRLNDLLRQEGLEPVQTEIPIT